MKVFNPSAEIETNDILEDLEQPAEAAVNEETLEQQATSKNRGIDLDLPDPEETIVLMLFFQKNNQKKKSCKERKKKNSTNAGMTSVIAK